MSSLHVTHPETSSRCLILPYNDPLPKLAKVLVLTMYTLCGKLDPYLRKLSMSNVGNINDWSSVIGKGTVYAELVHSDVMSTHAKVSFPISQHCFT